MVDEDMENKEEVKETKEINEESKLDVLKRKIDVLLESQATTMNAIGSFIIMSDISEEHKKLMDATLENIINYRDKCMSEVIGEEYTRMFNLLCSLEME